MIPTVWLLKNVIIIIWWQKSVLFTWTKIKNPKDYIRLSRGNSSLAVTTPLLCCSASVAQTLTSQQRLVPLSWHVHHNKTALPVFGSAPESNLQNSAILQLSCSHLSRLTRTLRMLHVKSPRKRVFSVCPLRARVWLQRQYFCGRMMIYIYIYICICFVAELLTQQVVDRSESVAQCNKQNKISAVQGNVKEIPDLRY